MKYLILYFSGVGNTKMIAEHLALLWKDRFECDIYSIEKIPCDIDYACYDGIVFGTPTYHASPAKSVIEFVENHMPVLLKPVPTFLYTTCGLYPANTLRIFANVCIPKNLIPVMSRSYRCAATDGMIMAPFMKVWFQHEKHLLDKLQKDSSIFVYQVEQKQCKLVMPRFRTHGFFNYPNKVMGQHFHPRIYTHQNKCVKCGICVVNCPQKSISFDDSGYPVVNQKNCMNCYRCIHHCPRLALSLSKNNDLKRL